jgi:CHAT domain
MARPPDFDLEIDATDTGFTVEVQAAYGVGELPAQPFMLPIDLGALPKRRNDVAAWVEQTRITRLSDSKELRWAETFGSMLFDQLFQDEVLACFRTCRSKVPPGEHLRVRLRLPAALTAIPWELLYDKRDDQFLVLAPDLALVRYPRLPTPITPLRLDGPLQVVVVLASAPGYAPINLDRELRRIEGALKSPLAAGRIKLDVIRGRDTLGQLSTRLRKPVHVLHVLCHGDLDIATSEGMLLFEDPDGDPDKVTAELLRLQLQKQRGQTQLVLLNACLGALPAVIVIG